MIPINDNPHNDLSTEELQRFSKVLIIENAISNEVCDELVILGTCQVFPAVKKHNRQNNMNLEHCFLEKDHMIHSLISHHWERALDEFNFDISFLEPYKLQTYANGGYFNSHIDNYHGLNLPVDRKLSTTIQLTHETHYEGGDLIIGNTSMPRTKGTMIIFPSFYPHKVTEVTKGRRWCVVAWAWGPYWK